MKKGFVLQILGRKNLFKSSWVALLSNLWKGHQKNEFAYWYLPTLKNLYNDYNVNFYEHDFYIKNEAQNIKTHLERAYSKYSVQISYKSYWFTF